MAARQFGHVPCACAHRTRQARCVKALQHGKTVSSASGSDEGARRQIGHAATTGAANSGVTSPRRAPGAAPATDTGTTGRSREVWCRSSCGAEGLSGTVSAEAGEEGGEGASRDICTERIYRYSAGRRPRSAIEERQAFGQHEAKLRRLM